MDESEYHEKSILPLSRLLEFAEGLEEKHEIMAELGEGILSITMPDGREYVINKHTPSRQIWVSSPYSGAGYFEFDGKEWMPKRAEAAKGRKLEDFIISEIQANLV
jgi:frataxin